MKKGRLLMLFAGLVLLALAFSSAGATRNGRHCSDESLDGAFGYRATATVHVPPGTPGVAAYAAAVGRFVADGEGGLTGHDVSNVNGVASPRTLTGTYTVNRDCTGDLEIAFVPGAPASFFFVIVDDGEELRMVSKTPAIRGTIEALAQD